MSADRRSSILFYFIVIQTCLILISEDCNMLFECVMSLFTGRWIGQY